MDLQEASRLAGYSIGDILVQRVLEAEMPRCKPQVLLPDAKDDVIARHRDFLQPYMIDPATGFLILSWHSFVVRTARSVIVVDTCGGNDKQRPQKERYHLKRHPYLENLAALGLRPEEVDFVLCTHLHVDHVGWNTRLLNGRWVPTFPNAKYIFSKDEWSFWQQRHKDADFKDDPFYDDSILPVLEAGQAELVSSDYQIDEGVWLEPSPGHTPGHVCVRVSSGGKNAVLSGDLMHHVVQVLEPDWNSCWCVDAERSRATRRAFLEKYADTGTLVMAAHFPTPSAGRVETAPRNFRFRFDGPYGKRYS